MNCSLQILFHSTTNMLSILSKGDGFSEAPVICPVGRFVSGNVICCVHCRQMKMHGSDSKRLLTTVIALPSPTVYLSHLLIIRSLHGLAPFIMCFVLLHTHCKVCFVAIRIYFQCFPSYFRKRQIIRRRSK